jgi:hypothetical protein
VLHQDEWVLVTDDNDPERVWQEEGAALAALQQEGWAVQGGAVNSPC